MSARSLDALVEDLATAVVMADASDADSLTAVRRAGEDLAAWLAQPSSGPAVAAAQVCVNECSRLEGCQDAADVLAVLSRTVTELQRAAALPGGICPAVPAAAIAPLANSPAVTTVMRDEDTIGLIGEFLSESEEGLSRADQILLGVERDGASAEAVNGLFRVFHTIKGVSGFLELPEITALAHTTETLLNLCREGSLTLAEERLDVVFDATAIVRKMLGELRTAVQDNRPFATAEKLDELLARIRCWSDSGAPASAENASVALAPVAASSIPPAPVTESPAQETGNVAPATELLAEGRPESTVAGTKLRETVKVDLERVDSLVEMVGELVVVEAMVVNAPEIAHSASARVRNCLAQLAKVTRDLQDVGMRMRMLPVAGVFQKMQRMARDLCRKTNKQVRIVLSGEATEMDRSMVEQIADPLVHMIRNAVDHGIEPAPARVAAGKPAEGTIRLSAYHEGGSIVIEVADDGHGLDREAILAKARKQGLIGPHDDLSEVEIHSLIFAPGFSTAKQVTEVSGRGVGMDVVKRNIDAMRGRVTIATACGQGTTFKIMLPLTLAIIDGMLVASGRDRYIIPTLSIVESIQPDRDMLLTFAGNKEMINVRGEILPLARLDRLFAIPGARQDATAALVVIVEGVGARIGLLVDEVITQQQVVIKSLGQGMGRTPYLSGAAILADGRVGLILNVEDIATRVSDKRRHSIREEVSRGPAAALA